MTTGGHIGVHTVHCCKKHGCKYYEVDCPVVTGKVEQRYPCEECIEETVEKNLVENYHELLSEVETKHPGETRHQTALRYIREGEARCNDVGIVEER